MVGELKWQGKIKFVGYTEVLASQEHPWCAYAYKYLGDIQKLLWHKELVGSSLNVKVT